ncbi:MAG: RDD family protein [Blastocatellia bacterium]|nr:RDD family protein [Blastocatellia bacterium]
MAEETLIIETPEHVELQFALASLGNRFLACAIDHAIQLGAIFVILIVATSVSIEFDQFTTKTIDKITSANLWTIALTILAVFTIYFGYFAFFEAVWSGQTPGKRWLRLRVIKEDGRPINAFESLSRNLLRGVDFMPLMILLPLYSIGILSVFISSRSKRLGDFVAGTVVIKERTAEAPSFDEVFVADENDDYDTGYGFDIARRRMFPVLEFKGEIRAVTATEIEVVEAFLRRRYDLPELPRQWMAWRIALPLLNKVRPQFDPDDFSYEGFLEELLARYRKHWN